MSAQDSHIAWVEVIGQQDATGDLALAYDTVKGAQGTVENLYLAMSQTPRVIGPADAHYRAVLHNPDNPLERWLAELVATYAALLCGSGYAVANHGANFRMYLGDPDQAGRILAALRDGGWESTLDDPRLTAALRYTRKLSLRPQDMAEADIAALREAGFGDKEISYLVQIVASFAYWARVTNALGIALGDTVGLADEPQATAPGVNR